jgi:hypothetical protein
VKSLITLIRIERMMKLGERRKSLKMLRGMNMNSSWINLKLRRRFPTWRKALRRRGRMWSLLLLLLLQILLVLPFRNPLLRSLPGFSKFMKRIRLVTLLITLLCFSYYFIWLKLYKCTIKFLFLNQWTMNELIRS